MIRRLFNLLVTPTLADDEHVTVCGLATQAAVTASYWLRPFDQLADARRWRWQPRRECPQVVATIADVVEDKHGINVAATGANAAMRELRHRHDAAQARAAFVPWWKPWAKCGAVELRPYQATAWAPLLICRLRRGHRLGLHAAPVGYDVRFFPSTPDECPPMPTEAP